MPTVRRQDGAMLVLKSGDKPDVLAENRLDDDFSASPASVGNEVFLRGEQYLYCIAKE